jgi:hypothetical protein
MSKIIVAVCIISAAFISGCKSDNNTVTPPQGQNSAPNSPEQPKPADGAVNVPRPVSLEWICTDPDPGDVLKYDLYFGNDNPPATILDSNINTTSYSLGMLSPQTQYYWKIVAKDDKGGVTSGPVWKFTTAI